MFKKNKHPFLLSVGFFLIAVSPLYGNPYLNIVAGLSLILISILWK